MIANTNNNNNFNTNINNTDATKAPFTRSEHNNSRSRRKNRSNKLRIASDSWLRSFTDRYSGALMSILSTIYLSSSLYIFKFGKCLNVYEMAAIQFALAIICSVSSSYYKEQSLIGSKDYRHWLLLQGLLNSISFLLIFFSVRIIFFGDLVAILHTSPVVIAIFARFFYKERPQVSQFFTCFLSASGVLILSRPQFLYQLVGVTHIEFSSTLLLAICAVIVATVGISSTFILNRRLNNDNENVNLNSIIFYSAASGLIFCLLISLILYLSGNSHTEWHAEKDFLIRDIGLATLSGLLYFIAQIFFTNGLQSDNSKLITFMRIFDIAVGFLLEYLILSRTPDVFSIAGASIIAFGIMLSLISALACKCKHKKQKKK